ncbi:hypothetical protein KR093_004147 [Drosophila rubida]|uniref:Uncharacterized protein n=1 Tax=Drosophila rubida TaxID=30044 RepID=A0AAD4PN79_9MUSC|nr:hypothetical protein KR093_004147 [Drosophila rubida]
MDRRACKESSDATLAYGLGFLAALGRLQWPPGGSVGRLPAGGPCCVYDDDEEDNCSFVTRYIPEQTPRRANRPVCVVFDESDPISALEHSFEFSTTSTQTIFVEHKSTQTDERLSFSDDNRMSRDVKQRSNQSTQYEEQENLMRDSGNSREDASNSKKPKKQKEAYPAPPYYPSTRLTREANIVPKQPNVLQKMLHWKQNFLDSPKVEGQATRKDREILPEIYDKLDQLLTKVDRQDEQIQQLQQSVGSMKQQDVKFSENSIFAQKKTPFQQPPIPNRVYDEDAWAPSSSKKTSQSTALACPKKCDNAFTQRRPSKVEFAAQSSSSHMLQRKFSSECNLCAERRQPVLDDLIDKVQQLIGKRTCKDIMITLLLRSDNVYHVNVQERQSKRNLGCVLANHAAIEKAAKQGFFDQFLTYTVTDVRNTITSPTRNIGIPFEIVSPEKSSKCQPCDENDERTNEFAVCEFITKVLRMPMNK